MRGHNPAWANLPRRKCDDCGKSYKPIQPLRPNTRGFCSDNCRKSYHKHGGAYRKLKAEMQKMVTKHMAAINDANQTELRILVHGEMERFKAEQRQHVANAIQGWIYDARKSTASPLPNPQPRA